MGVPLSPKFAPASARIPSSLAYLYMKHIHMRRISTCTYSSQTTGTGKWPSGVMLGCHHTVNSPHYTYGYFINLSPYRFHLAVIAFATRTVVRWVHAQILCAPSDGSRGGGRTADQSSSSSSLLLGDIMHFSIDGPMHPARGGRTADPTQQS